MNSTQLVQPPPGVRKDASHAKNTGAGADSAPISAPRFAATRIAVLVPCKDEEAAIDSVVRDFRAALPCEVYVYDNNSADRTVEVARRAGARVGVERLQGKGNVVRRMFSDIDADVYVLVDGDDTYDATCSPAMVARLLDEQLDMVNAARRASMRAAYPTGHRVGNIVLTRVVGLLFGHRFNDVLSGYRAFSRRFVKSFPALSTGFEIEIELTVHALELRMPVSEMQAPYRERGASSRSKLHTVRDGWRITRAIVNLAKEERPLEFFAVAFAVLAALSLVLTLPIFVTYHNTGLVPRFPTVILSSAIMLLAFLCLFAGIILDTVTRGRRELKRLRYLEIPAPSLVLWSTDHGPRGVSNGDERAAPLEGRRR